MSREYGRFDRTLVPCFAGSWLNENGTICYIVHVE